MNRQATATIVLAALLACAAWPGCAEPGLYALQDGRPVLVAPSARGGYSVFLAEGFEFSKSSRLAQLSEAELGQWLGSASPAARPAYSIREVTFAGNVPIVASLFMPAMPQPVPAVVIIHGSGTSDRDNLWYVLIARSLVENGVAVLLPDKRGSGKSGGRWESASFRELAGDTLAGVDWLKAQAGVDPQAIGILGLSQGGWVAPLAASLSADVSFIVSASGSAVVTPRVQTRYEIRQQIQEAGAPSFLVPVILPFVAGRPMKKQPEWWALNGDFEPLGLWRELRQPALLVFGETDDNVPVAECVELLQGIGKPRELLEWLVIPEVGHGLIDEGSNTLHSEFRARMFDFIKRQQPR